MKKKDVFVRCCLSKVPEESENDSTWTLIRIFWIFIALSKIYRIDIFSLILQQYVSDTVVINARQEKNHNVFFYFLKLILISRILYILYIL